MSATHRRPRFVFIARHGEREDRATEARLARRGESLTPAAWKSMCARPQDPPLSRLGRAQAQALGRAVAARGLRVRRIYSSPFVRCVQTSDGAADGLSAPAEAPLIAVEEGLCEECCSFRFPTTPIFLRRLDLAAVSARVDLEYVSATRVEFQDMALLNNNEGSRSTSSADATGEDGGGGSGAPTVERFAPVRHLVHMGKTHAMPLGHPEEHYIRELNAALPNPFDRETSAAVYRAACDALALPGPVKGHPGWEVTFLRIRDTLARLGLLESLPTKPQGGGGGGGGGDGDGRGGDAAGGVARAVVEEHDGAPGSAGAGPATDDEAVLLVTHGACSNILYELMTGRPPASMATVGSFFLLERQDGGDSATRWRDASGTGGQASTDHISDHGNAAH